MAEREYRHLGRVYPERPSAERDMTLATLAAAGITAPPRMAEGYRSHSRPLGSVEGWAVSLLTRRQMLDAMTPERRERKLEEAAAFGIDLDEHDRQPVRLAYLLPTARETEVGQWVDRQYASGRLAEGYYLAEVSRPQLPPVLDMAAAGEHLGVSYASIRAYRRDEPTFPEPDLMLGNTPGWRVEALDAWAAQRPGRGAGGGRPRKGS